MSLKIRLTLLFVLIIGGMLLLFSTTIYALSSLTLIEQIDDSLEQTMNEMLGSIHVTREGRLEIPTLHSLNTNMLVQAWTRNGQKIDATSNISTLLRPLDPVGLQSSEPIFREVWLTNKMHLRVLSAPLDIGGRQFGTIQAAMNMEVVDAARATLSRNLSAASIVALMFAGGLVWIFTSGAMRGLEDVTEAAMQITETNDLSRRIPWDGPKSHEVGQLVQSFNLNLSRLERLLETQRRFLADVGHELRTPLTVIKGNVALVRRFGADEESLDTIDSEVDRLTRLVGDLLLLAQAEAGKLPLDKQPVELDTVLFEVFQSAQILAKGKCQLRIGAIDQVLVCGDQDRLQQVLINLISNGIKYTPPGGEVIASLTKDATRARLEVRDTGPGIPQEDLPHIFERFYRAEKARQRSQDGKGFGLGLSIAYWIVQNHDGEIVVDSKLGEGTTFRVSLPLIEGDCGES